MKFCSNCGTQNDDNTAFCAKCGKPFGPAAAPQQQFGGQQPFMGQKAAGPSNNPFVAFKGIAFILLITAIAVMSFGLIAGIIEMVKGTGINYETGKQTHDFYVTLKVWFNYAEASAAILFYATLLHILSAKKSK